MVLYIEGILGDFLTHRVLVDTFQGRGRRHEELRQLEVLRDGEGLVAFPVPVKV